MFLLPTWFLKLNGIFLVIMGLMLVVRRVRDPQPWAHKLVGLVWALLCMGMGVALLLMAWQVLRQPIEWFAAPPPPVPIFPTGR